jgi:XTP/dITP diphosphohydrolase
MGNGLHRVTRSGEYHHAIHNPPGREVIEEMHLMRQVLLATRNQHKVRELTPLLQGLHVKVQTLDDFPHVRTVEEDQPTLEGNALKKAREVFRQSTMPALADDTGLEVFYLNDAPGVHSSRYAGPGASYDDNCRKLLAALRGVPPRRRAARFRSVMAFVGPGTELVVEGRLDGVIIEQPRGKGGFGYDPIFMPAGGHRTLAEMTIAEKNAISHRGAALRAIHVELEKYFKKG